MNLHLYDLDADASGGVLYVTIEDTAFPEEGWYDLVRTDLDNWLPGLLSFARGHTDSCVMQFMDGPAAIRLRRRGEYVYALCLWNHETQIPDKEIDFPMFLESTAKCIRRYNRAMHEMGKTPPFVSELAAIKTILIGETYV